MQAAIFRGAFAIQVEQIPDAVILEPTDAVVQITHACICGTDLRPIAVRGRTNLAGKSGMNGWAWSRMLVRRSEPSGEEIV